MNMIFSTRNIVVGVAILIAVTALAIMVITDDSGKIGAATLDENMAAAATTESGGDQGTSGESPAAGTGPDSGAATAPAQFHETGGQTPGSVPGAAVPGLGTPSPGSSPAPGRPPAPGAPPQIISRGVAPQTSRQGDALIASAMVGGDAERLIISCQRTDGHVFEMELQPQQSANGYTIWLKVGSVAEALAGEYVYYARAYAADGTMVEMPGTEGYTFRIDP